MELQKLFKKLFNLLWSLLKKSAVSLEKKRLSLINKYKLKTVTVENFKIVSNNFKKPWIYKDKFKGNYQNLIQTNYNKSKKNKQIK